MKATKSIVLMASFPCSGNALAQSVDQEPAAVVELGGAPDWSLKDRGWSFGPTAAVEVTPIENWLELEAGVTPTFSHHSTEWDTDLLFKKPWTLSRKVEFMFGAGPSGFMRGNPAGLRTQSEVRSLWTLCSGPRRSIDWAATLNLPTSTTSGEDMSDRLA